jgi:uncharacterized protein (TIGR00255 family)
MTAYAQQKFTFNDFSLYISFKSLNHRFLDIYLKGSGINPISEKLIREIISSRIFRGKVEVVFDLVELDATHWNVHINKDLLAKVVANVLEVKNQFGKQVDFSMESLLKLPMIFQLDYFLESFAEERMTTIKDCIEKVFSEFLNGKESEGRLIGNVLHDSMDVIDQNLEKVAAMAQSVEGEIFKTYRDKIAKLLADSDIEDKRITQEAAIAAEKCCIAEEINRLKIHNKRLKELILDQANQVKGKEADFYTQEMLRETHTIAAKTFSMDIHQQVILIRREIEKIKQQIQNIE